MKPGLPSFVHVELTTPNTTGDSASTRQNLTGSETNPLRDAELAGLVITGIIGIIGVISNSGVLFIVYKGGLVKKDYRMLYYIFITVGDLLFSIHTILNSLSILYRDLHVLKIFWVCMQLQVTLGVVTYQWSAMCIILLLIDLIWSLSNPFCDDRPKKMFSKIACICAFLTGLMLSLLPFVFWGELPDEVQFCSVANVYGNNWIFAVREATGVLTVLITLMIGASTYLMITMYREQRPRRIRNLESRRASSLETEEVPEIRQASTRTISEGASDVSSLRIGTDSSYQNSVGSTAMWAKQNGKPRKAWLDTQKRYIMYS